MLFLRYCQVYYIVTYQNLNEDMRISQQMYLFYLFLYIVYTKVHIGSFDSEANSNREYNYLTFTKIGYRCYQEVGAKFSDK